MNVKNVILTMSMVVLVVSASAQPRHQKGGQLQQVTTISGTVVEWMYNDDFEYDGLSLNDGGTTVFVKFPPHLAQQARNLGNHLTVNGVFRYNPEGVQELKMVSMSGNGQTVYDQKSPYKTFIEEPVVNGKGRINQVQITKNGDDKGYILDNGVVLRIPPRMARQLTQMIQTGAVIGYTGIEKVLKPGHVRASENVMVHGQTISIDGVQYLIR